MVFLPGLCNARAYATQPCLCRIEGMPYCIQIYRGLTNDFWEALKLDSLWAKVTALLE